MIVIMPKTFLKQKNNKRATSLIINSNIDTTNIGDNNSNNVLIDIKPKFPPTLTTNDLIKNALKADTSNKSKAKSLPNAFIAYRMALIKEYRNKNLKLPQMGHLSKIAKNSWNKESQIVKCFYNKLAEDAKYLYKQSTIQIVLDSHMNKHINESFSTTTTTNSTSFITNNSSMKSTSPNFTTNESEQFSPLQNSSNGYPIQDSIFSVHSNNFGPLYEMNSIINDREEYIRFLEQTIYYLLGI